MKTKQYTAIMLVALFFAAALQAQPARRSNPNERKERTTVTKNRSNESKSRNVRSTTPARKVEQKKSTPVRQRQAAPSRQVQSQRTIKQRQAEPTRQVQRQRTVQQRQAEPTRQVQRQRNDRPVSISTPKNPRSDYRSADTKVYTPRNANSRVTRYSSKKYYGGNHYHYFYPTRKVKIHYHHDTYVHHYHVLYRPVYHDIFWTRHMYRDYHKWYPHYRWNYRYGYRIQTMSVFDAKYNLGEVANVYGRVYATWYNNETDDLLLFFGGDYPYQEFTVVLPGRFARKYSWRPERYFLGEHITVTGLITTFEGNPEIIVKNRRQFALY